jgi:hypothetical protein
MRLSRVARPVLAAAGLAVAWIPRAVGAQAVVIESVAVGNPGNAG